MVRTDDKDYDWVLDKYFIDSLTEENGEAKASAVMNIIDSRPSKIYGSCIEKVSIPLLEKVGADGYSLATDEELQNKQWRVGGKE